MIVYILSITTSTHDGKVKYLGQKSIRSRNLKNLLSGSLQKNFLDNYTWQTKILYGLRSFTCRHSELLTQSCLSWGFRILIQRLVLRNGSPGREQAGCNEKSCPLLWLWITLLPQYPHLWSRDDMKRK